MNWDTRSIADCAIIPDCLDGSARICWSLAEQRLDLSIDVVKPIEPIGKLRCPVFIISGERDDKTWLEVTQRLFDAAKEQKEPKEPKELWMIPDARHQDPLLFPGYEERTRNFLMRCFAKE